MMISGHLRNTSSMSKKDNTLSKHFKKGADLKVGVLGGSFDPPHLGHIYISDKAIELLGLDYIIWIVSPQNPMKDRQIESTYEVRAEACASLAQNHTKIMVSDFELQFGIKYTFDTLEQLTSMFPEAHFIWLMGADNMLNFHKWYKWQQILDLVDIAVFNRNNIGDKVFDSEAALFFKEKNAIVISHDDKKTLSQEHKCYLFMIESFNISSTEIRNSMNKNSNNAPSEYSEELKNFIVKFLEDKKAEDVLAINMTQKTNFADYMILASGSSARHINSLAENLQLELKKEFNLYGLNIAGKGTSDWILIDVGPIVVHIFKHDARSLYDLENLWNN